MLCKTTKALPENYQPGMHDVICGRGKTCYRHPGNLHMRNIVATHVEEYSQATTKAAKSTIVTSVVREIEALGRGFVKEQNRSWHCVTLSHAREKVSQAFRDLLNNRYKSSIDSRREVRQAKRQRGVDEPQYRPAKKLHTNSSSGNKDADLVFELDTNRRPSFSWLQDKEAMLNIEDDKMDWLSKPDEIFSVASTVPTLCCSDMFDSQFEFDMPMMDSHILDAMEALDGNFFDDEPTCENQEPFRESTLMLQRIMAKELD